MFYGGFDQKSLPYRQEAFECCLEATKTLKGKKAADFSLSSPFLVENQNYFKKTPKIVLILPQPTTYCVFLDIWAGS